MLNSFLTDIANFFNFNSKLSLIIFLLISLLLFSQISSYDLNNEKLFLNLFKSLDNNNNNNLKNNYSYKILKRLLQQTNSTDTDTNTITYSLYYEKCIDNTTNELILGEDPSLTNITFNQYINSSLTGSKYDVAVELKSTILEGKSLDPGALIIPIISPFLVFAAFLIITIIFWLISCLCCCCPCLCCKTKPTSEANNQNTSICNLISLVVLITFALGLFGISIAGFAKSSEIPKEFDKTECVLIKFYLDLKYGEDKEEFPRWAGTQELINKLNEISSAIDEVAANADSAFNSNRNEIPSSALNDYKKVLENGYSKSTSREIDNPAISNKSPAKIKPGYIEV